MIYDKTFFMGLAIVAGGLVLGGGALSLGLSTGGQSISLDAGFNESDAGLLTFKCTNFTCADKKGCFYGGEYIASQGDKYRYGSAGKKHLNQDQAMKDFLKGLGFTAEDTNCDKLADKLKCNPANRKVSDGDGQTNKQLKEEFRTRASDGDMCFVKAKDDVKLTPTPTPTPTPGAKLPEKELKAIFACKTYKCWYKTWTDPRLPLMTPDDPVFVNDNDLWGMIIAGTDSNAFEYFVERRHGIGHGTEICRSVCNGNYCDVHCQKL
ncbi:MAG: hypothetical protein A3A33_00805 [Candidatus Yanofskybacteria bacterium RIFCSPLOWO2_01_FULL_49_25]|uniref:Uncharacterized protein n=1 Tax=Candidatus Yanofskybacteria bacterium RIFCSPLOWO2_01_FULL_49_25 TaxID=1802701 RepID=A0A1F8GWL9_9BACT|nr:MAG: hypothetical protein A3A33_00805 [Candidatus Yanofskybacteria bacterium RIFCSPLOWO2_01_FULL_49_25]